MNAAGLKPACPHRTGFEHRGRTDWVEEVDWTVGRVLDAVGQHGLAERTLVLFTSDNGATAPGLDTPLRGHNASTLEGGMRVPTLAWWPGRIPAGTASDAIAAMKNDLGTEGIGPGCRELGRVENPKPLIPHDTK